MYPEFHIPLDGKYENIESKKKKKFDLIEHFRYSSTNRSQVSFREINPSTRDKKENARFSSECIRFPKDIITAPRPSVLARVRRINENRVCVNARNTAQISYRAPPPPYTIYQPPFSRSRVSKKKAASVAAFCPRHTRGYVP